jgi:hypothetical protein
MSGIGRIRGGQATVRVRFAEAVPPPDSATCTVTVAGNPAIATPPSRATLLRVVPPTLVKEPSWTIRPSGWRTSRDTPPLLGLKPPSRVPLALRRAMLLRVVPLTLVNPPPMTMRPSGWTAEDHTVPLMAPASKPVSREPSASRRAMSRRRTSSRTRRRSW